MLDNFYAIAPVPMHIGLYKGGQVLVTHFWFKLIPYIHCFMLIALTRFHGIWRTNSVFGWILGFLLVWFQNTKQDATKSVSGIIHDHKVIGAGFNLLVNATNDDDEEEDIEPLEWLNCAANKANMANKEMVICSTFYHKYVANIIWRTNFSHSDWSLCKSLKQSTDRLPGLGEIGSYCTFTTWLSGQKLFYMKHVFILWWEQISRFWWFFNPNIGGKQGERGELSTFTCLATLWTGKHDSIKCKCVNFRNYNALITIQPVCQFFEIIMN